MTHSVPHPSLRRWTYSRASRSRSPSHAPSIMVSGLRPFEWLFNVIIASALHYVQYMASLTHAASLFHQPYHPLIRVQAHPIHGMISLVSKPYAWLFHSAPRMRPNCGAAITFSCGPLP